MVNHQKTMNDNQKTINHYQKTIERQWLIMIELQEGTFLVLEVVQEYENSGDHTRVQGKYLPVIRRHILRDYGFLSEDNGWLSTIFEDHQKTLKDYGKTMTGHKGQSKTMTDYWWFFWRLWKTKTDFRNTKNQYQFKK